MTYRTAPTIQILVLFVLAVYPFSRPQEALGQTADPADVATTEAITNALYEAISGGKDVERDWPRFRTLFVPEGRLIPTGITANTGQRFYRPWDVEGYISQVSEVLMRNGFFEREVHRVEERFGDIAHVFSTYESRRTLEDPEPFQRGINSIQLYHDGSRWWILTVLWDSERADNPIPEKYLPGGGGE